MTNRELQKIVSDALNRYRNLIIEAIHTGPELSGYGFSKDESDKYASYIVPQGFPIVLANMLVEEDTIEYLTMEACVNDAKEGKVNKL